MPARKVEHVWRTGELVRSCATRDHLAPVLVPNLRRVRDARALTQEELADRAGVSRNTIRRAEQGEQIRQSSVRKLARALRVSPARLQQPTVSDD